MFLRAIGLGLLAWVAGEALAGRAPRSRALAVSVLAWAGAAALATLASISPRLSLAGEIGQREGLLTLLALAGLHLAAARSHRNERDVRVTSSVVILCAVAAAVYAQLQLAGLDPIAWSGAHTYAAGGGAALRPAGPLGNPILLGIVLAAALPIVLARLAEAGSDAAWLVPAAAVLAASLVMTLSRGAWLAAAVGLALALGLALRSGARARRVGWTFAASLLPALVFGMTRAHAPLTARLGEGIGGSSIATRAIISRGALRLWSERPWLGVGPDAFALAYPRVQEAALWRDEWIGHPLHAHSVPLQSLATLGIAGTLTGLGWIAAAAYGLRRAWLEAPAARPQIAALVGTFTALLVAGSVNVVGPAGAALFAVCTALAGVLAPSPAAPARPLRPLHPALPAVAAVLVCLFAIATGVRELRALTLAQPMRVNLRPAGASPAEWRELASARAAAMQRAVSLWPRDDLLWRLACQASLAEGDAALATADTGRGVAAGTLAETAARRAVSLEPARAEGFLCLGDALAARALRTRQPAVAESAAAAYARATSLAPADGWLLVASARFQLARRDGVRALEIARRLTALYPEAAVGHALSGAALLLLDRPDEARAELARALAARWEEDAGEQHAAAERLLESLDAARSPGIDGPRVGQQMAPPRR